MGDVQGLSVQGFNYHWRKLSWCNYLEAIFLSVNFPGGIVWGAIVPVSNFPGVNCSVPIVFELQFQFGRIIAEY